MNYWELLGNINFLAVVVSALSAFIVGWVWYGPLFGKLWMKLNGFTEEELKEGGMSMPVMMLLNYIATALAALAIAVLLSGHESSALMGVVVGLVISIFWIGTNRLNDVLYERKPFALFLINVGYNVVIFAIMGGILGAWH